MVQLEAGDQKHQLKEPPKSTGLDRVRVAKSPRVLLGLKDVIANQRDEELPSHQIQTGLTKAREFSEIKNVLELRDIVTLG